MDEIFEEYGIGVILLIVGECVIHSLRLLLYCL